MLTKMNHFVTSSILLKCTQSSKIPVFQYRLFFDSCTIFSMQARILMLQKIDAYYF